MIAVAKREIPYTVCDSDVLDHALGFVEGVSGDLVVRKKRDIAFGLRKENPQLKVAVDAFVMERILTAHARELQRVDFEGIQQRGSIRVLTTNDAVSYFLHKGQQRGFDYELIRLFAKKHGLRVDVIVPPSSAELVPWLLQGRGDVIAAMMPPDVPPHPELAFSPPYLLVEEVLIQSSREQRVMSVEQLRGRKIEVPGASAFWRTLNGLQKTAGPFILVTAPAGVEPPELVEKVAEGAVLSTVVSVPWSKAALSGRFDVMATLAVGSHEAAFATRADAPKLQQKLSDFVKQHVHKRPDGRIAGSAEYNVLRTTYLEDTRRFDAARIALATPDRISKYDDVIKKYANMYGIDWRLMAAQSYQESGFDPSARSWVGAVGLFQVMPATGAEMGFSDLKDPEQGVHAGIKYMAKLIDSFEKEVAFKQRVRFALAAYNAGRGHVEDARDLAASMKLDRNKWFGNVEKAMLLLEMPRYFRKARYGYCRGSEPVKYVSEIQSLYDNFTSVVAAPGAAVAP